MEWIDINIQKPSPHEMVIFNTDKGVAVGCYDFDGDPQTAIFGFVGTTTRTDYTVKGWMPMPKA